MPVISFGMAFGAYCNIALMRCVSSLKCHQYFASLLYCVLQFAPYLTIYGHTLVMSHILGKVVIYAVFSCFLKANETRL